MKKTLFLFAIMEALPLSVFLIYATSIDKSNFLNWLGPYLAGSIVAVVTTAVLIMKKVPLNRLFIGINIYFLTGCYGLLANKVWLNQLYARMQASGMLAWIIIVGVVSLLLSPAGFIGIKSSNRKKIIAFSLYLLLIAQLAYLVSLYFKGNKILSEFVPFIVLFATQGLLKSKLLKNEQS